MRPSILNINNRDLVFSTWGDKTLQAKFTTLVQPLAEQKMGCRMVVVPPGNTCWPYHFQFGFEEIYVILDGEGVLSNGEHEYPVRKGDVVSAAPVPGSKQQLRNTGAGELRYLAVCLMDQPDRLAVDLGEDAAASAETAEAEAAPDAASNPET